MKRMTQLQIRKTPVAYILFTAVVSAPAFASAAITDICGIVYVVNSIARWFGIIVFIVSVVAFLYAAFLYLTSGGSEENLTTARQVLIYAVIGTAVALLATSAVSIVSKTVGGTPFSVEQCPSLFPGSQNLPPS